MELQITQLIMPEEILFNYEPLKKEISDRCNQYANIVYTDEDIGQAKEDRANLNRLKKALNDRRIQIEKEYMKPFSKFKGQINEIIDMLDEPAKLIDQRVKEYEKAKQDEKAAEITAYFEGIEEKPEWLKIGQLWNPKWLNATKSMKSIREEINLALEGIKEDLATLAEIHDFGFEATEEYKRTLDINKALSEGMRLAEIQKRKEAEEQRRKEAEERIAAEREAERQRELNNALEAQAAHQGMIEPADDPDMIYPEPKMKLRFEVELTTPQAQALRAFCDSHGIKLIRI